MSGFEPIVAEAAAAELGTTALATEVMAPEVLSATAGAGATGLSGISGLFGTGLEGMAANGGLGSLAPSTIPTMAEQLVTANPEALAQLQSAVMPSMSPEQLAQITNGIPTAGPGVQVADAVSGMGNVTPEMLDPNAMQATVEDYSNSKLIEPGGYTGQTLTPGEEQLALKNAALQYPQAQTNPFGSLGDMAKSAYEGFKAMPMKDKMLYGGVASLAAPTIMGMLKKKKPLGGVEPYSGPLSKFQYDPARYTPLQVAQPTPYQPRYAQGGLSDLGGYSDGGRMLKGPGDGMSDNIPASIAGKQPARLANEEFVIPADVVSHLGNGSSEAGAKQLYKMMDRVRQARTGNKAQGKQIKADKYMPV
jgi:hypothetical protein